MKLQDIFIRSGYRDITSLKDAQAYALDIRYLYQENENGQYCKPEELLYVYYSKYGDEIFLVIDGSDGNLQGLSAMWDERLLTFSNFGSDNEDTLRRFTYNMVQIILAQNLENEDEVETSLSTSRKIVIPFQKDEEENIIIDGDAALEIPFYLEASESIKKDPSLVERLQLYIPDKSEACYSVLTTAPSNAKISRTTENFEKSEFDIINGWMMGNDSSNNNN